MYHHEIVDLSEDSFPFKLILHNNQGLVPFIPKHWHRSFEVSFTYSGSIESFSINRTNYQTTAGDILLINPNVIHEIIAPSHAHGDNIALSILFPVDFMKSHIPDFDKRYFLQPQELQQTIKQKKALTDCQILLSQIVETMLHPNEFSPLIINGAIFTFLYKITKYFSTLETKSHTWNSKSDFYQMSEIINFIDNHFKDSLTISQLAKAFNLSEGYFSRFFKTYMDTSVMAYVDEIRLRHAYQLLLNTDLPINVISDQSGFPNIKSFNRVFRVKYETTPSKYRKLV